MSKIKAARAMTMGGKNTVDVEPLDPEEDDIGDIKAKSLDLEKGRTEATPKTTVGTLRHPSRPDPATLRRPPPSHGSLLNFPQRFSRQFLRRKLGVPQGEDHWGKGRFRAADWTLDVPGSRVRMHKEALFCVFSSSSFGASQLSSRMKTVLGRVGFPVTTLGGKREKNPRSKCGSFGTSAWALNRTPKSISVHEYLCIRAIDHRTHSAGPPRRNPLLGEAAFQPIISGRSRKSRRPSPRSFLGGFGV